MMSSQPTKEDVVVIITSEAAERVRRMTSQMRFVEALNICEEELKRVHELFCDKHGNINKKWLKKFDALTQDERDVIATDFIINFHSMAIGVATFARNFRFTQNYCLYNVQSMFGRREVTPLPVKVRGISGAMTCQAAWAQYYHGHSDPDVKELILASKLLKDLISFEWRLKYAEALAGSAEKSKSQLEALNVFNWLDYPPTELRIQKQLLCTLILDSAMASFKKKRGLFSLDERDLHLICYSTIRIFKAAMMVRRFSRIEAIFGDFCFNHQNQASRDNFLVLSVYEEVHHVICYCLGNIADFDHDACDCMLKCIWHGRDVFFNDVTLQSLLTETVATHISSSSWKSCPCLQRHLYRAAFATNVKLTDIITILKRFLTTSHREEPCECCETYFEWPLRFKLSVCLVAEAHDVMTQDETKALSLCEDAEVYLTSVSSLSGEERIMVEGDGSLVYFQLGLISFVRKQWRDASDFFRHSANWDDEGTCTFFGVYHSLKHLIPAPELHEHLERSKNVRVEIPVKPVAKFFCLLCRSKLEDGITKANVRDFAKQDVLAFNRGSFWRIWSQNGRGNPASLYEDELGKVMLHFLTFSLFKSVKDQKGAITELKKILKYIGADWPKYDEYKKDIKRL